MSILIPGRGQELVIASAETVTHRDAFISRQIGRTTIQAAAEERNIEQQLLSDLTIEEFDQFMARDALEDDDTTSPLVQYDIAFNQALTHIRGFFEAIGGYRFGFVNIGELILEQGKSLDPAGMTTLTIAASEENLRVEKILTITNIDIQTKRIASSTTEPQEVSSEDRQVVQQAITRLQQINRALG